MLLYFFTEKYIKNTLINNDLLVYNLNCQYESSHRFRNRRRLILWPQILHIEFNKDQVVVIV